MSTAMTRSSKVRGIRSPRMPVGLVIESKTIGTEIPYQLSTIDISKSGLLCNWNMHGRMPFIENTIVEMTIDPEGQCLGTPVSCLGKVVRRENEEVGKISSSGKLGIQILQMEQDDMAVWESCLSLLEKKYGFASIKQATVAAA